ncbi:uncharacterized protein LOC124813552 [Hydra vulgaris]|uniref:uncharacterized protein LOC124813552 n=1 Tax=Hydra vulgaris TaxID=6087 RepID=UPI0032EA5621
MIKLSLSRENLLLVGDGRCDSPGHNAKYCTYTFLELESGCVVDTTFIPVTEVTNSNCMEKAGFIHLLKKFKKAGLNISVISTDRHPQIRKVFKVDPRFNDINHQFDPWHVAKSIRKKMMKASKNTNLKDLHEWIPAVINHFWWSIETSKKNPQLMYEKFCSLLYHIRNIHKWGGYKYFKKCEHEPYSHQEEEERNWLDASSDSFKYLVKIVKNKSLKKTMKHLTEAVHTCAVEVFNNLLLKYIPKQYHFEYEHMEMGGLLAALDHNFNAGRFFALDCNGDVKYRVAWRKASKKFIARKVKKHKRYDYLLIMKKSVFKRAETGAQRTSKKRVTAPTPIETKNNLIARSKKVARFSY